MRARRAPAEDDRPHPDVEASDARRLLRLDDRPLRRPGERQQDAAVERVQPVTPPPPARDGEDARRADARECRGGGQGRETRRVRRRETGAE